MNEIIPPDDFFKIQRYDITIGHRNEPGAVLRIMKHGWRLADVEK